MSSPAPARRRLPRFRSDAPRPPKKPRQPRRPFAYGPEARPERQPGLAARLPARFSRLVLLVSGVALVAGGVIALGVLPGPLESLVRLGGSRFAGSTAAVRDIFRIPGPAADLLAEILLLASAGVALAIGGMRRHRLDGKQGRHRGWGAMALVLATAAVCGRLPVGRLVSLVALELGGVPLGRDGAGWWMAIAGTSLLLVAVWALLPLHGRLAPAAWFATAAVGWTVCAAAPRIASLSWFADRQIAPATIAAVAWLAAAVAMVTAMLVAARGVIREARGEIRAAPVATSAGAAPVAAARAGGGAEVREAAPEPVFEPIETDDSAPAEERGAASDSGYTDGSELEDEYAARPLSKAEKKRLRKMARMGHAA